MSEGRNVAVPTVKPCCYCGRPSRKGLCRPCYLEEQEITPVTWVRHGLVWRAAQDA